MPDGIAGVLNLVKPVGMTSHDVVAVIRRLAGQKSVGHAGTLDPLAEGVLVLLLGRATALSSYATGSRKLYAAEVAFGVATDTDDAEGSVCRGAAVPDTGPDEMRAKLQALTGDVLQVPPRFSAIKREGKTAYVEARKGNVMEMPPRLVQIHSITLLSWCPPRLKVLVATGPGTYIRSLARDVGELCGSAAYLHALVRLASGGLHLRSAVRLVDLTRENLREHLQPPDSAVSNLPALFLSAEQSTRARHGGEFDVSTPISWSEDQVARLYDSSGQFVGLARPLAAGSSPRTGEAVLEDGPGLTVTRWRPIRILEPAA